jgi:tRNA(Ile)-lysidine synthetase-like protein
MDYNKYEIVLDTYFISNLNTKSKIETEVGTGTEIQSKNNYLSNKHLLDTIHSIENNICNFQEPLIISLSGGVDSMVILYILKKILNKNVIAGHINYKNREETDKEEEFLKDYCEFLDVKLECIQMNVRRGTIKRAKYEDYTKKVRFEFYKTLLNKHSAKYILLGHHKDDIVENIFNNISRGRELLDLAVIKLHNNICGVDIVRPLIDLYKDSVYELSRKFSIPYFKDTTPDWSLRGIFRRQMLPLLEKSFNGYKSNLLRINSQCEQWSSIIENNILVPFYENMKIVNYNEVEFEYIKYINYEIVFWKTIFKTIFHNTFKLSCPSDKSIENFIKKIKIMNSNNNSNSNNSNNNNSKNNFCISYVLTNTVNTVITNNKIKISKIK